jgi:pilus assembly protein Flp/PilA
MTNDQRFQRILLIKSLDPRHAHQKESKMNSLTARVQRFLIGEDGPTAVEYAVMLALIIVTCVAAIKGLSTWLQTEFSAVSSAVGS